MSKTVTLEGHFDVFIDTQLTRGRFGSADDVVRAGLRLLEDRELELAALQAALIEGENSGPSTAFDVDDFLASMREPSTSR